MKLTKEDLDKVRNIEGFPIGKDEDIIALSRPPYYTACPNPFIKEFIEENGTPYDEETDNYHCEPFAADVSEGKNDIIYGGHGYHTKVPYKAIMRYILHYTKPRDLVFDGFCGTGMTGVAAQMCAAPDKKIREKIAIENNEKNIQWGKRNVILNDLSTVASFIAQNYNTSINPYKFEQEANLIMNKFDNKFSWMYETYHVGSDGKIISGLDGNPCVGLINYTVWSDLLICPSCTHEFVFFDVAFNNETKKVDDIFKCPHCGAVLKKKDCHHAMCTYYDEYLKKTLSIMRQAPVMIEYTYDGGKYTKKLDEHDFDIIKKIQNKPIENWIPINRMCKGVEGRRNDKNGIKYVHQFYTKRNMMALGFIMECARNSTYSSKMMFLFEQLVLGMAKISRYVPTHFSQVNQYLSGTLYIGSQVVEASPKYIIKNKIKNLSKMFEAMAEIKKDSCIVQTGSLTCTGLPDNCIDYIFTDPPFGNNLNYVELNYLWEVWYKVLTNDKNEAIIDSVRNKGVREYEQLMESCFKEYYRVLKPNRWMTVEFHNSQNSVWNAMSEALQRAGFVIADVRVLDKKQGTFKQILSASAVKKDLVISVYKPRKRIIKMFSSINSKEIHVWEFVKQHLDNLPIAIDADHNGMLDIITERCNYLLFDRMVAYHIVHGIPVPMDAHTFYEGLRQRFVERDGMFFNSDQVNEYDEKRLTMEVEDQQMALFVTDEKNAIAWLHQLLDKTHLSYQEIQPKYLQELHQDKREEIPELLDMLKENFVQDAAGKWYIPDLTDAADLAKLRRKKLLKEFYDSYATGKQKIKVARQEAIRAGFDDCWAKKDYATIVHVGDRLPEAVLQEDQALLMYYDNASSRV